MGHLGFGKISCIIAAFCVAIAVASHAQTFTSLKIFTGSNGNEPGASLIQGTNGNFYGTTEAGGASKAGSIFDDDAERRDRHSLPFLRHVRLPGWLPADRCVSAGEQREFLRDDLQRRDWY